MRCNDFCAVYEFYYKYSGLQRGNKREVIVWNPGIKGGIPTKPVVANVKDLEQRVMV